MKQKPLRRRIRALISVTSRAGSDFAAADDAGANAFAIQPTHRDGLAELARLIRDFGLHAVQLPLSAS